LAKNAGDPDQELSLSPTNKNSPIKLKDIADLTGYSIKTISRVVNGHPDVNDDTRVFLKKVIEDNGYLPNAQARSLRQNQTFTVGFVVPDLTNVFFGQVGVAIDRYFLPHGVSTLIGFSGENVDHEIAVLKAMIEKRVDGIILATVGAPGEFIRRIVEVYRIPLVVIDNEVKDFDTHRVLHDNVECAYRLVTHLADQGYKRIACVAGILSETSGDKRKMGYEKALAERGLECYPEFVVESDWTIQGGIRAAQRLIDLRERPEAIFVSNTVMAFGVYQHLKRRGLSIPDDIAVVGFDHLDFIEAMDPPITTISRVEDQIGTTAARLLHDLISSKEYLKPTETLISGEVIGRESSLRKFP
jgi:LacI family transcriptional regulator